MRLDHTAQTASLVLIAWPLDPESSGLVLYFREITQGLHKSLRTIPHGPATASTRCQACGPPLIVSPAFKDAQLEPRHILSSFNKLESSQQ